MMKPEVAAQLIALNHTFYTQFGTAFAVSRRRPWTGFGRLAQALPQPCDRFLDVGCGTGRLGQYLLEANAIATYIGVDFSAPLLAAGPQHKAMTYFQRDITMPGVLADLGYFAGMACVATMQHIPGAARRAQLLREMAVQLEPGGRLILVNWQFMDSDRQRRKLLPWSAVGLTGSDVEPGDYLLSWQRGGAGRRYVSLIDAAATEVLAASAELQIIDQFRADGREGDLNLYTIMIPRSDYRKAAYET